MGEGIRRVLAATDFSATARMAVDRAARIAAQHRAELVVAHVLRPLSMEQRDKLGEKFELERSALASQALAEELRRLSERATEGVEARLLEGPPHREIDALACDLQADVVVVGAAGHGGWRDALLGSTTDRLLRLLACPALVARQPAERDYARIASCTDFSDQADNALRCALQLAPQATHFLLHLLQHEFDASVAFSLLPEESREAVRRSASQQAMDALIALADSLGGAPARIVPALREGHPSRVLDRFVAESELDLVVVGAQGRSRLERGFLGSVSRHAASSLSCDVLVVPAARA